MKDFSKYSAIIVGAGDATGGALTKKFASHGYKVCPARRPGSIDKVNMLAEEINSSGGWAKGFGVDARDEDAIKSFFKEVEEEIAPIDVVIFNPGGDRAEACGNGTRCVAKILFDEDSNKEIIRIQSDAGILESKKIVVDFIYYLMELSVKIVN